MKKWGNELTRALSKGEVQVAKNHMNKYLTSLAIKEIRIKTTLRFHLSPIYNGYHQEYKQQQMLVRMWGKRTLIHCW
jgi:hypothetical protein